MTRVATLVLCLAAGVRGFAAPGALRSSSARPSTTASMRLSTPASLLVVARPARQLAARIVRDPRMGLFGLGAPELAIIAIAITFVLGPEQVTSMAKKIVPKVIEVGSDLKQLPDEFNKGIEDGKERSAAKFAAEAQKAVADSEKLQEAVAMEQQRAQAKADGPPTA